MLSRLVVYLVQNITLLFQSLELLQPLYAGQLVCFGLVQVVSFHEFLFRLLSGLLQTPSAFLWCADAVLVFAQHGGLLQTPFSAIVVHNSSAALLRHARADQEQVGIRTQACLLDIASRVRTPIADPAEAEHAGAVDAVLRRQILVILDLLDPLVVLEVMELGAL